jgi:uncharacterized protein (DUF1684 family)
VLSLQRLAWASCLLLACTSTPTVEPPGGPDSGPNEVEKAARAFQVEYERELRADEHSFLTVVAAHYLAPGQQLRLTWNGSTWVSSENDGDTDGIRFESTAEALLVHRGTEVQRIESRGVIEPDAEGRFSFTASRQESDWRVFVHDRDAPLRHEFPGIAWFPIHEAVIVEARFESRTTREPSVVQTSRGVTKTLYIVGEAHFELDGRSLSLLVFGYAPEPSPDEPLLIPFRDETSGHESYAAGRYLEPTLPGPDDPLLLDFNRATNPLCAYSEHYNCPVPPRFNTLPVRIRAGAMSPEH